MAYKPTNISPDDSGGLLKAPPDSEDVWKTPASVVPRADRQLELETVVQCVSGHLTQAIGAKKVGVSTRQFQRLIKHYRQHGADGLLNRNLGVKPHNAFSAELVDEIARLYQTVYYDIGPLQTSEYLAERHGIKISKEALRKILIERNLWVSKGSRTIHRRARERRTCHGEMVQMDSSIHRWLGQLKDPFWLIICVDDASSTL